MRRSVGLLLVSVMVLTACGSRLNPFNWFGGSREARVERSEDQTVNPLIPQRSGLLARERAERALYRGEPVDLVSDLVIERLPGGAIVRATGISRFQDLYEVQLTPANEDEIAIDGVLTYRLEGRIPDSPVAGGPERVRSVTAARALTNNQLDGVRQIRVEGATNARVSSRR